MPTTTKMGIVYPASTDLVKDGATAMGTISTTVDSKSGLILINTTSFSGVASQSINDVFSTNFTNYKIIVVSNTSDANSQILRLRLRVSSTDNSSSNYYWAGFGMSAATSGSGFASFGSNGLTTSFDAAVSNATSLNSAVSTIELLNPFATDRTSFVSFMPYTDAAPTGFHRQVQGQMSVTTSYTGFTLISATGNITGSVSVYGYNK